MNPLAPLTLRLAIRMERLRMTLALARRTRIQADTSVLVARTSQVLALHRLNDATARQLTLTLDPVPAGVPITVSVHIPPPPLPLPPLLPAPEPRALPSPLGAVVLPAARVSTLSADEVADAVTALVGLGYRTGTARIACAQAAADATTTEELITAALRVLDSTPALARKG